MRTNILFFGFLLILVVPEILIFGFDQEACDNWTRMLPVAIFAPFFWSMAIFALGVGIFLLYQSFMDEQIELLPVSIALICPGVFIPCYWIKRIIIDDCPAFGNNPDNIYAVAGLNTMAFGIICFAGGLIIGLLLLCFILGLRRFF
ncbi:MAG: hypothetical protein ABH822_02630 [Patescibacteria group bacterium]